MDQEVDFASANNRLSAVRAALTSSYGTRFDRLARLAARAASAPAALITIGEHNHVEVRGAHGLTAATCNSIVSQNAFCACATASREPLVYSKVQSDNDACCDHAGLRIAAGASFSLVMADGTVVGCLCAFDEVHRDWTEDEIQALRDVADEALCEVELEVARNLWLQYARELDVEKEHNLALLARHDSAHQHLMRLGLDETARERAETARGRIESILEGIADGFFALDSSMRFTYINERATRLLHRSRGELVDKSFEENSSHPELVRRLKRVQMSQAPETFEYTDASHGIVFEILAYPSSTGISVCFHDVTERRRSVDEIEQRSIELQALSRRLVEVQESERGRIARELHDEIGQILTGLKLTLSAVRRLPDDARDVQLEQALKLVNELIGHVRDLSLDLRPGMLDDLGLLPALLWHIERYTSQTGVSVQFNQTDIEGRFHQDIETAAYRIVQEALTNVARYSQAREAVVNIHNMGDVLHIEVNDAGVGFEPELAIRAGASNGLTGMRERVNLLRGMFSIVSAPGTGTTVFARIPIPAEVHHGDDPMI